MITTVKQLAEKYGMTLAHEPETSYTTGSYDLTGSNFNCRIVYGFNDGSCHGGIYDNQAQKAVRFEGETFVQGRSLQAVVKLLDKKLSEL